MELLHNPPFSLHSTSHTFMSSCILKTSPHPPSPTPSAVSLTEIPPPLLPTIDQPTALLPHSPPPLTLSASNLPQIPSPLLPFDSIQPTPSSSSIPHSSPLTTSIDISTLPILANPLQKHGRHTVIRGRLRPDHPFARAASNLGYILVSHQYQSQLGSQQLPYAREWFMRDLNAFLNEIGNPHFKIPIIGGGDLDLYRLIREVMSLGGVHNVVRKRAFRLVAQQLDIPKTCTSAASVLKGAYEKLLFHYEQRLVYGKWPEQPNEAVNMKARVSQERLKEKQARSAALAKAKTKSTYQHSNISTPHNITQNTQHLHRLLAILTTANEDAFGLPQWAINICQDHRANALLSAIAQIDIHKVLTPAEVVLVALCECFSSQSSPSYDLSLAHSLLLLPPTHSASRRAQGLFFNLLVFILNPTTPPLLSSSHSAAGLIEGLLHLLTSFLSRLEASLQNSQDVFGTSPRIPFRHGASPMETCEVAAAYCALRSLVRLGRTQPEIVYMDGRVARAMAAYLRDEVHRTFIMGCVDGLVDAMDITSVEGGEATLVEVAERAVVVGDWEVCEKVVAGIEGIVEGGAMEEDLVIRWCRALAGMMQYEGGRRAGIVGGKGVINKYPGWATGCSDFASGMEKWSNEHDESEQGHTIEE